MPSSLSDNHLTQKTMILSGQGQVSYDPNIAIIRLGVHTTGLNAAATQAENSKISQTILQELKKTDISTIKTFQYLVDKNYEYENGNRIDKGYSVRNTFEIKTTNLEQVGLILDTAVNYGANFVELIEFGISNPELCYQQALNLAILNALKKSKSIALTLGLATDATPIKIIETSSMPVPFSPMRGVQERTFTTPIEPGQKQINAMVNIEFLF